MMNFDGLDPGMGEYPPSLHGTLDAAMEPSLDPHLNPGLLQGVELDPEGLTVTVPESVHLMEGMFSELHSVVSEVGIPVTATHFDLQEEMLWMGNHRVRASSSMLQLQYCFRFIGKACILSSHLYSSTCSFLLGSCHLILWTNNGSSFFFPSACDRWRAAHSQSWNRRFVSFKVQSQMPHARGARDVWLPVSNTRAQKIGCAVFLHRSIVEAM